MINSGNKIENNAGGMSYRDIPLDTIVIYNQAYNSKRMLF